MFSNQPWQQKATSGEKLRKLIFDLAEKYGFSTTERLDLGNALQEFSEELLVVRDRDRQPRHELPGLTAYDLDRLSVDKGE